jgi:integrase
MIKQIKKQFHIDHTDGADRVRRVYSTKEDARQWVDTFLSLRDAGVSFEQAVSEADGCGWTMSKLRDAVEGRYWRNTPNERTATINADEIVDIIGPDVHPRRVTAATIDLVIQTLRDKGLAPSTVNRKLSTLSKMLNYAVSRGIIPAAPKVERSKEPQGRLRWYTRSEESTVLAWCAANDPELGALVVFLADTGCRLGEAIRFDPETDADDVYVRFHQTKSGKNRAVPMTPRVREIVRSQQAHRGMGLDSTFQAHRRWQRCRKACGLSGEHDVLHAWRHTCASRLVQAGLPIQVVQQWLGHSSLTMTLRYAHLSPANMLAGVQALAAVAPTDCGKMQSDIRLGHPFGVML